MKNTKIEPIEVSNEVPVEFIEEGAERKLQKVEKYNAITPYEGATSSDEDFEFAQDTIKETILKSNEVLQELGQAAILNENGKLYESYSQLMKNIIDGSSALLDLHVKQKKVKEIKEKLEPSQTNTQINNIVVGSTKDLLDMIENKIKD
jgi:hypothetical protein